MKVVSYPKRCAPERFPKDWHALVRAIYAARVDNPEEVAKPLRALLPPDSVPDIEKAAQRLLTAIVQRESILIFGDYDVDGATATALCVSVIEQLGGKVDYFIPNRQRHGYGLTVRGLKTLSTLPALVITVDNGIRSFEAAEWLQAHNVALVITDHHQTDTTLPRAQAVVNPNRQEHHYLGNLSGVGVAFYVLLMLRRLWYQQFGNFPVDLNSYLDLVALGTVADKVPLDRNNRILVAHGIARMRTGQSNLGIQALIAVSNQTPEMMTTHDIDFSLAPILNAVGRLSEMSEGVALLLSADWQTACDNAQYLERFNRSRKALTNEMERQAALQINPDAVIASAYQADWHEGIIGIVAARLSQTLARPALVATQSDDGLGIKGSMRSIAGVDIHRLLIAAVADLPSDCIQFGGHAMAAGFTVLKECYPLLLTALKQHFERQIGARVPEQPLYFDAELPIDLLQLSWAHFLENLEPWGAGFPPPQFCNRFIVADCRALGAGHTRLVLREPINGQLFDATWFFHKEDLPSGTAVKVVYQLEINRFFGDERLNLLINALEIV